MDSSKTFEPLPPPPTLPPIATDSIRVRGHRGGVISMHRALAHFRLGPMNLIIAIALFLFFSSVWLVLLPRICNLWSWILASGIRNLPLHAELVLTRLHPGPGLWIQIPRLRMEPVLPTLQTWSLNCLATLLLFAVTFALSDGWIPLIYLLRGMLLVEASALIYFAVLPARFPHTPDSYLAGLITSGMALISTVPLLFGLIYYIFDFGLLRKAALTALTMAHLTLFLPFQVLLQALILQKTVLYMPVLYIIFGMPLDVLLIIAFYSWGMTWSFRPIRLRNEHAA